jgi:hypothetical protein
MMENAKMTTKAARLYLQEGQRLYLLYSGPIVDTIRLVTSFAETHCHSLVEMDINPLLVTREKCIAADVMICEAGAKH